MCFYNIYSTKLPLSGPNKKFLYKWFFSLEFQNRAYLIPYKHNLFDKIFQHTSTLLDIGPQMVQWIIHKQKRISTKDEEYTFLFSLYTFSSFTTKFSVFFRILNKIPKDEINWGYSFYNLVWNWELYGSFFLWCLGNRVFFLDLGMFVCVL